MGNRWVSFKLTWYVLVKLVTSFSDNFSVIGSVGAKVSSIIFTINVREGNNLNLTLDYVHATMYRS